MRTLRTLLVTMVVLLPAPGLTTTAQEGPAPVTFVTGTVVEVYGHDDDGGDVASRELRGYEVMTQSGGHIREVVEWSDPRLPTDLWLSLGYTLIWRGADQNELDGGAINTAWRLLLEDEKGRWRGTGREVDDDDERFGFYELTGEGAYAGLSALLHEVIPVDSYGPWPRAFEGFIFEAGLTPFPDEPVPVTTGGYQVYPFPTAPAAE